MLRYRVRKARAVEGGYYVEDTETGKRKTEIMRDRHKEDGSLVRPAVREKLRRIAKRMNHQHRQEVAGCRGAR